jgi:hypothetical protein
MNPNLILLLAAVAACFALGLLIHRLFGGSARIEVCNIGEGRHADGHITYIADAAHAERYSLVKRGVGGASSTAICGAADVPIGVSNDEPGAGDPHRVALFSAAGTRLMVASAAITQDALLEPAANGRVATAGTGTGTHYIVGRALTAASAAGQFVEVDAFYYKQVLP